MKKALIAALLLALPVMANAADGQPGFGGERKGGFKEQLTDEQRACLEAQNCPKREMKKPEDGLQPGQKPERKEQTAEEKSAREAERECQKKAFETCGIQMPKHPEGMPRGNKGA
jgi:hypothetical protein